MTDMDTLILLKGITLWMGFAFVILSIIFSIVALNQSETGGSSVWVRWVLAIAVLTGGVMFGVNQGLYDVLAEHIPLDLPVLQ